jgi:hypothetical protein
MTGPTVIVQFPLQRPLARDIEIDLVNPRTLETRFEDIKGMNS